MLLFPDGVGHLFDGGRLISGIDDGFESAFQFDRCHAHLYCSSIACGDPSSAPWASGPAPAKTSSNILCLRSQMEPKISFCVRTMAWRRTSSSTASTEQIIAERVGQA